jgi:hypothetical protein
MSQRVQHLLSALQKFKRMKPKNKKVFLKSCKNDFIHGICECVRNLLKGHIPLKSRQLKCLSRHKQTLRKLSLKNTSLKLRKKILQKGGFLGALISPLITGLASLLGGYLTTSNAAR